MSIRVTISEQARANLRSIYAHSYAQWGEEQATRYDDALDAAIDRIGDHPNIGKRLPHLGPSVHRLVCQSHVIVYERVSDDEIEILRIVHGNRRLTKRLLAGQA